MLGQDLKEMIDQIWEKGRREGLSDAEITHMIEEAIQAKKRTPHRSSRRMSYTPMTDEEIKRAQELINSTGTATPPQTSTAETLVSPERRQVLYGSDPNMREYPPRKPSQETLVTQENRQVLYGPRPDIKEYPSREPSQETLVSPEKRQVLYGPRPDIKEYPSREPSQETLVTPENRQVLYGPRPYNPELQEMIADEDKTDADNQEKKNGIKP